MLDSKFYISGFCLWPLKRVNFVNLFISRTMEVSRGSRASAQGKSGVISRTSGERHRSARLTMTTVEQECRKRTRKRRGGGNDEEMWSPGSDGKHDEEDDEEEDDEEVDDEDEQPVKRRTPLRSARSAIQSRRAREVLRSSAMLEPRMLIGKKVAKLFDGSIYHGIIDECVSAQDMGGETGDDVTEWYLHVTYDDGDREDVTLNEAVEILMDDDALDLCSALRVELVEAEVPPKTPSKRSSKSPKTPSKQSSAAIKTPSKRSSAEIKTPSKRSSKSPKTPSKRSSAARSKPTLTATTIATRGLPLGSLAKGVGGFELRSLDGVAPLLTVESLRRAINLVSQGQLQQAARELRTDADCVRAFCKAACARLSVQPLQSVMLEGGEPMTAIARERLEQGVMAHDAPLPGRIMVVRAGSAVCPGSDAPLCPPELVDRVFASAEELHQHTALPLATYELEPCADQSFAPWSAMAQRLTSAGLLPIDDDAVDTKRPLVMRVSWRGGVNDMLHVTTCRYEHEMLASLAAVIDGGDEEDSEVWALLEGVTRNSPPVLLGVPSRLLATEDRIDDGDTKQQEQQDALTFAARTHDSGHELMPPLSTEVRDVRLPQSLLQKALRRGFCSPLPLLDACTSLLRGDGNADGRNRAPRGGAFAMLSTLWRVMLVDASPFDTPADGAALGLCEIIALSLVARADASWVPPASLRDKAVRSALRLQQRPINQWIGFVSVRSQHILLYDGFESVPHTDELPRHHLHRAAQLRNAMRCAQHAVGCTIREGRWGSYQGEASGAAVLAYLNPKFSDWHQHAHLQSHPVNHETALLNDWRTGLKLSSGGDLNTNERVERLDAECRLAAYDAHVAPSLLLLLQAMLSRPPRDWKKHALPSLAMQARKLSGEVNARLLQRLQLARVQAWGKNNAAPGEKTMPMPEAIDLKKEKMYKSAREVVTTTGVLSEKELEIVDALEAAQRWQQQRLLSPHGRTPIDSMNKGDEPLSMGAMRCIAGRPPSAHDGRVAFLLCFAKAVELEVTPRGSDSSELVNVLFCGVDENEPLLVQRIGRAREEAAKAMDAPVAGMSGAAAAPSLGYVQRSRSVADRLLVEAAEDAMAHYWRQGKIISLPLPPAGFQWELGATPGEEVLAERNVALTATFTARDDCKKGGGWRFTINGVAIPAFDARAVISPCSLDMTNHTPLALDPNSERAELLRIALYVTEVGGASVLVAFDRMHTLAVHSRAEDANEGAVYDWLPFAANGDVVARTWRDALLAIKTRDADHVVLGAGVLSDGSGVARDMSEGVLLRIFHGLEFLYPTALIKEGAYTHTHTHTKHTQFSPPNNGRTEISTLPPIHIPLVVCLYIYLYI